ncbi:TPA: hypothetical protein J1184_004749 [Escherichia coli]|nr:hypothetical protein [Escherichia coli]HBA7796426.1 hypothetical protein [Escherichia coli]HBA8202494.1 hypothetical protein [Escherichia coli]HBA8669835.1 hypothetical protein [Escherichia coli]HBA8710139.1 hypothetical protein [Escherichia coli]
MKNLLLGVTTLAISFAALAGGGGSSWQPQVSPAYCVTTPSPQEEVKWRSQVSACQEVIENGYARGVLISGVAVYKGGQITQGFTGTVTPGSGFLMNVPKSINGAKFVGLGQIQAQWIN